MEPIFKLEVDLVESFKRHHTTINDDMVITEMPIRFGNIDVVIIKNTVLPFSYNQVKVLSKPAAALLFTKIKHKRPISKKKLLVNIGLSQSTVDNTLYELMKAGLICKKEGNYYRTLDFEFPKTIITGYEAKLKDFNKAFYQAKNNKEYTDYSYLVFPINVAESIKKNKLELLQKNGIGLIGVSETEMKILVRAKKNENMKSHLRLLNITKAYALNPSRV
ncbi:hypothetical protein [Turicibacter sanguinis]|uniref:hypothetical protein n=1 Tax=Turicibacter sanguinis TaxID=154288 RepID=UPI0018AC4D3B|nr:hypothetical protein [Turicibacter sanguinis]